MKALFPHLGQRINGTTSSSSVCSTPELQGVGTLPDIRYIRASSRIVRVEPGVSRRIFSGPEGVRILALGGVPGAAYEPPDFSKIEAS